MHMYMIFLVWLVPPDQLPTEAESNGAQASDSWITHNVLVEPATASVLVILGDEIILARTFSSLSLMGFFVGLQGAAQVWHRTLIMEQCNGWSTHRETGWDPQGQCIVGDVKRLANQ